MAACRKLEATICYGRTLDSHQGSQVSAKLLVCRRVLMRCVASTAWILVIDLLLVQKNIIAQQLANQRRQLASHQPPAKLRKVRDDIFRAC